jgi:hypothetical protein
MQTASFAMKAQYPKIGMSAFEATLPFSESKVLSTNAAFIAKSLGLVGVKVISAEATGDSAPNPGGRRKNATPGRPTIHPFAMDAEHESVYNALS